MRKELISVIVPIYNVEKYLQQCLDSIINQTYKKLEIILIDDGSVDNCPTICDEYAKKDKRIRVIHKENKGISHARNTGLDISNGNYIAFVDGDDYIESTMIETLYKNLKENNSDISICNYYEVFSTNNKLGLKMGNNKIFTSKNKYELLINDYKIVMIPPWGKIYKKEIFNNIKYPNGMIMEDSYILTDILKTVNRISYINTPLYYYVQRENSIMKKFTLKRLDSLLGQEKRIKFCIENNLTNILDKVKLKYIYSLITRTIPGLISINEKAKLKEVTNRTKQLAKEIKNSKNLTLKERLKLYIISLSPISYIRIRELSKGGNKNENKKLYK